ncbi:MAG: RecQ family ATP-dependent DNA helicase [Armatimonadetes bacterium]|nr:RecQ family ATP-dependent DNA helicase [Armatimonadota bacterium]MBS1726039.1 RecQ family ATP-dependent DNA helicase [Armatimonadota bacterium]
MSANLLELLREGLKNANASFHSGQEEAIRAVIEPPYRALVVQATGWGKSMVYFIATRVLRDAGRGPTLVVSPLLSLMRNQVVAAQNLGIRAEHYTSSNPEKWESIEQKLLANEIDLLLISPERFANEDFQQFVASSSLAKVGLLVIDEAHCISDWGHDFRPDYQRLGRLIRNLPPTTSVLATTATANDRVVEDVLRQIGNSTPLIRGSLARRSLKIQVINGFNAAERLAWLSDHLDDLDGSGIIYTLTKRDADRVTKWLQVRGHRVEAYHADLGPDPEESNKLRIEREAMLLNNDVKALVSTVALGMGFDKPDLGFVVHYQSPGNLVAYYQQIGRAGRAIDSATAVLFLGQEDESIHEYFIERAAPSAEEIDLILTTLDESESGLSVPNIMAAVDLRKGEVDKVLKCLVILEPSPILKLGSTWSRTPQAFTYDKERDRQLKERREEERARFVAFASSSDCFMEQVRFELNDETAEPCGQCSNCIGGEVIPTGYTDASLIEAQRFLNESEFLFEPRKRWESGALSQYGFSGNIKPEFRCEQGLCLSYFGDPGIGTWTREDKHAGKFRDDLVIAAIEGLERTGVASRVAWITSVPSLRSPTVPDFSQRLAAKLGVPYLQAVEKIKETPPQKSQRNSHHQSSNLDGAFAISEVLEGTVLLVDDMVDSRWTFTIVGALLRQAGVEAVIPFALTSATHRGDDE